MAIIEETKPALIRSVRKLGHVPAFVFSLRWRLSFVLGGIILLCTAVGVLTAVIFLQSALTDRATNDLRNTVNGASAYLDHEQSRLLSASELVSEDPAIQGSLDNRLALINKLLPYYNSLNVDILDVIDRQGRVVVNMEDTGTYGSSVSKRADVHQALSGEVRVGLARDPVHQVAASNWAIQASVPLQDGARIVGAVVVGRRLDSAFAADLSHIFNADVNVIAGNRRTGSTQMNREGVPVVGSLEPPALRRRMATGIVTLARVREQGHTVLSGLVPLSDAHGRWAGAVELVRPLDPLYGVINRLSLLLLGFGILIVIGGTLLALYLLRRITRRLLALETVASEVVTHAEEDAPLYTLRHTLPVQGKDEVGSLARSVDSMMRALDDRMTTIGQLYTTSQARVNELTGLAEVARLLTAGRPIDETLESLSQQICRLVGCKAAAIYVPADERTAGLFGSYGLPKGFAALISSALAGPPEEDTPLASQAAFWSGEPAWRPVGSLGDRFSRALMAGDTQDWGAATAIPLRLQHRNIGVMTCYTRETAPLSASDMHLLTTVAGQVAVAVENARLYTQAREGAAMEERAHLARELHDSVTQALFSMTLHARAAQVMLGREELAVQERLDRPLNDLCELTRGALAEMRALIFELRPNALSEEGLAAALQKQGTAVSAREGLRVDVDVPESRIELDPEDEEHLYRVCQEALHNAVKHAQATHAQIRLWTEDDRVLIEVTDDGIGFDTATVPPGHLGLRTMADRMEQIGGAVEIISTPGTGTTVHAEYRMPPVPTVQPGPAASVARSG